MDADIYTTQDDISDEDGGEDEMSDSEVDEEMEAILYSHIHFEHNAAKETESGEDHQEFQTTQQLLECKAPVSISVTPLSRSCVSRKRSESCTEGWTQTNISPKTQPVTRTRNTGADGSSSIGKSVVASVSDAGDGSKIPCGSNDSCDKCDDGSDTPSSKNNTDKEKLEGLDNVSHTPTALPELTVFSEHSKVSKSNKANCDNAAAYRQNFPKGKKTKSPPKQKFDMEAELGIKKSHQNQSPVPLGLDTLTVIPNTVEEPPRMKAGLPEFISLRSPNSHLSGNNRKQLQQSPPLSLKQLSSLIGRTGDQKHRKEVVMVDSDDSTGGSSISSSDSSTGDSDSDSTSLGDPSEAESESEADSSDDSNSDSSQVHMPMLDLNWNVNASDRKMIQTYEEDMNRHGTADKSKWEINDVDMFRGQSAHPGSRYYTAKDVRCNNCDRRGHLSTVCPEPKKQPSCGLCGEPSHIIQRCPNRLCYNCNQPGHTCAECPSPRRSRFTECRRCWMKGHMAHECPDHWRQYHMTITSTSEGFSAVMLVVQKKQNSRVYCCNCAKKGHFAFECTEERMDKYNQPSYPFIASYDDSTSFRSKNRQRDRGSSDRGHQRWHSQDSRSGNSRSERWESRSNDRSHSWRSRDRPERSNLGHHRTHSYPELDHFSRPSDSEPDPAGSARQVSRYTRQFLNQDISGDRQGHSGSGDGSFKTPATPSKSRHQKRRWKGRDSSGGTESETPHTKKKKKHEKWESKAKGQSPSHQKKKQQKKEMKKQSMDWNKNQNIRHIKEQVVLSSAGFRTTVNNLVISRTFKRT